MIRFKVVKASSLLIWLAVAVLAVVVAVIAANWAASGSENVKNVSARLVRQTETEASTDAVPASAGIDAPGDVKIEIVDTQRDSEPASPTVLIYHTHTHEAYEQVKEDPYEAVEAWRTTDADHSVVKVGEALAQDLRRRGFQVVHDTTDHENNALSTAYTRSLNTLLSYDRPFDLYIDLHRDAYYQGLSMHCVGENGEGYAQTMLLIGNGEGFDEKPYYKENLAFAEALTNRINRRMPNLCRPVLVKDGRYNQHIGVFSVLIEVGHNRNTLAEALNTVPILADAISSLMIDDPDPALLEMKR